MSSIRLDIQNIKKIIHTAINNRVFPGCVIGVVRKNGERTILPFGTYTYEKDSINVKEDTIYDVASITKAVATASSLLTLIDQKKISLTDSVTKYLPEFGNFPDKKEVTIKHLLTYTLNLVVPGMASLQDKSANEIIKTIVEVPLRHKAGSTFLYTNPTALLIGMVVERVSGKRLDILSEEMFFKPLNMSKTTFHPDRFPVKDIAPTEINEAHGIIHGRVHDESTFALQKEGYYYGIAGLFSTVPDLLTFLEMLLNGGELHNKRYFSEDLVKQMNTNQISDIGESTGLGWELNDRKNIGKDIVGNISSKTGFTGCIVYYDLEREVAVAFLSNRIYPTRPPNSNAVNAVRRDITDIIFNSLNK